MKETLMFIIFVISIILFCFITIKNHWRIQLMYNSYTVSNYTPDIFPIVRSRQKIYQTNVEHGENVLKNSSVVITLMLRDTGTRIPHVIKRVENVGAMCGEYAVLVVENDSKDDTRKKLLEWAKNNPRVKVLGCGVNVQKCNMKSPVTNGHTVSRKRIEKMVMLRNIYLDMIKQNYSTWDYVIMWDLDIIGNVYLDGIQHSFGYLDKHPDIDVVCANGIYKFCGIDTYYDTYALSMKDEVDHSSKTISGIKKRILMRTERGEEPYDVDACFAGFSIYRTSSIIDTMYDMTEGVDDNIECEHVRLCRQIKGRKVTDPSLLYLLLSNP